MILSITHHHHWHVKITIIRTQIKLQILRHLVLVESPTGWWQSHLNLWMIRSTLSKWLSPHSGHLPILCLHHALTWQHQHQGGLEDGGAWQEVTNHWDGRAGESRRRRRRASPSTSPPPRSRSGRTSRSPEELCGESWGCSWTDLHHPEVGVRGNLHYLHLQQNEGSAGYHHVVFPECRIGKVLWSLRSFSIWAGTLSSRTFVCLEVNVIGVMLTMIIITCSIARSGFGRMWRLSWSTRPLARWKPLDTETRWPSATWNWTFVTLPYWIRTNFMKTLR